MDQRREFVRLALQDGANRRELCRRFGIHPDTAYKWIRRWKAGEHGLQDRSRRPHTTPLRTSAEVEARIIAIRDEHPAWGARKIARILQRDGTCHPAVSTVHAILCRHDRVSHLPGGSPAHERFEKEAPNLLWQMDFKGWIRLGDGTTCHPLTVIDDHSRYVPCLQACANQTRITVQTHLTSTFERYGLPDAIFVDNGSPWSDSSGKHWTRLRVWLLKLGVELIYSRPFHPQSRGKNERFHRSLHDEVFALRRFHNCTEVQQAFDAWRDVYNFIRPHQSLEFRIPAERYRPSSRPLPQNLPQIEYEPTEVVRRVPTTKDYISFKGRFWKVPEAFQGERVAIRQTSSDGQYGIFFASHQVALIDLTAAKTVGHVSKQVSAISPD